MTNGPSGDWWSLNVPVGIQLVNPGIYEWRLEGIGLYIGQSRRMRARIREYPNNVRKLLAGAPYRAGRPTNYRAIHHDLQRAYKTGATILVTILENCCLTELNARERYWIARRREEARLGGPIVLNSEKRSGHS